MFMRAMKKITNNGVFVFIFLLVVLSILVTFMSGGILGNDFWWHIKVGEYICDVGSVPRNDIFSWYGIEHNIEWVAHEWLGDVILYKIFSIGGEVAIFCFSILMAVVLNILIWIETKKYIYDKSVFIFYYLVAFAITCSLFFYGRPQIFGFFCVYAELKILCSFVNNTRSRGIFFIPLIALLWSNIYGGSSNLSYILCCIVAVGSLFNFNLGKIEGTKLDKKALVSLLIVTICTVGALIINPIGLQVLKYPYENLSDSVSMSFISEWKAPDAKLIGNLILFFVPIALTVIGFIHTEKKIKLLDLLMSFVFVFLFLRSVRFIMLWYIAAALFSVRYLPDGPKIKIEGVKTRIVLFLTALICFFTLYASVAGVYMTCKADNQISVAMNNTAVKAVKEYNPTRLFNDYDLGETLIYNDIPVFFDARADLYSKCGILSDGLELMSLQPLNRGNSKDGVKVEELISSYNFDYILIKKARPLFVYLVSNTEEYSLVYEDDSVGLFLVL